MSNEREEKIRETLASYGPSDVKSLVLELVTLRRERHRSKLENQESSEVRGRAKECKDLIQIFS